MNSVNFDAPRFSSTDWSLATWAQQQQQGGAVSTHPPPPCFCGVLAMYNGACIERRATKQQGRDGKKQYKQRKNNVSIASVLSCPFFSVGGGRGLSLGWFTNVMGCTSPPPSPFQQQLRSLSRHTPTKKLKQRHTHTTHAHTLALALCFKAIRGRVCWGVG